MHNEDPIPGAQAPADDLAPEITGDLSAELEQLRTALASLREEALRERAELDNQRKRLARDVDMARKFANERLLSELLPVLDSLDAGLGAAQNGAASDDASALRAGLELTRKQLLKVAGDNGLEVVDPVGVAFDPDQHQAISQADQAGAEPGTVLQVFQKGYLLNGRLLRPALVVVARHPD
jgi:molecular chaperone GrpE